MPVTKQKAKTANTKTIRTMRVRFIVTSIKKVINYGVLYHEDVNVQINFLKKNLKKAGTPGMIITTRQPRHKQSGDAETTAGN